MPNPEILLHSAFCIMHSSASGALKPKEPRSLEAKLPPVALDEVAKLAAGDMELQPVTAFKLEGGIVGGGAVAVVELTGIVMMGCMSPLGDHNRRNGQSGRMVVLIPLTNELYEDQNENNANHQKWQAEHHSKHGFPSLLQSSYYI